MYKKRSWLFALPGTLFVVAAIAAAQGWKSQSSPAANANTTAVNANKSAATRKRRVTHSAGKTGAKPSASPCDPSKQVPADLSGSYKGVVNYPDGGLSGEATLTITGNQFLLAVGNAAQTGRITAVTTCSYTAVTMMFGESKKAEPGQPAPVPLPVVSLRASKNGEEVTLTSVPGERRTFSFGPKTGK